MNFFLHLIFILLNIICSFVSFFFMQAFKIHLITVQVILWDLTQKWWIVLNCTMSTFIKLRMRLTQILGILWSSWIYTFIWCQSWRLWACFFLWSVIARLLCRIFMSKNISLKVIPLLLNYSHLWLLLCSLLSILLNPFMVVQFG
jgi:hypothetical protein